MQKVAIRALVGRSLGGYYLKRLLFQDRLRAVFEASTADQQAVTFTTFIVPDDLSKEAWKYFLQRFLSEGERLVRLRHPQILSLVAYGEAYGYPYIVVPEVKKQPLDQFKKQRSIFSPEEALLIVMQVGEALDYAHSQNVLHGMLSSTSILVDAELTVQVAGLGQMKMLEMRGVLGSTNPCAHLLSVSETVLVPPEYVAPEYVQERGDDSRIDMYALGILLFELLTGTVPYTGTDMLDVMMQHVNKPLPTVHERNPQVPPGIDVIVGHALERDPEQRYQTAAEMVSKLERTLQIIQMAKRPLLNRSSVYSVEQALEVQVTIPPSVNWFPDDGSIVLPLVREEKLSHPVSAGSENLPISALSLPGDDLLAVDPFDWWSKSSASSGRPDSALPLPRPARHSSRRHRKRRMRRQIMPLLASGGSAVVDLFGSAGFNIARLRRSGRKKIAEKSPAPLVPSALLQPPQQSDVVIGSVHQEVNSASNFINPVDGKESILIHLLDGRFVAYERICSVEGVLVEYQAASRLLVCPPHRSMFDPADHGRVVSGPASAPLLSIPLQIMSDGSIVVGPDPS